MSSASKRSKEESKEKNELKKLNLSNKIISLFQNLQEGEDKGRLIITRSVTDDNMQEVCERIAGVEGSIKELQVKMCGITSRGAITLFNSLKDSDSQISTVQIGRSELDDECMIALGEYIQKNKSIKSLNFNRNRLTDKGIEILHDYVIGNSTLNELSFENNKGISDKSVKMLVNILENSSIYKLDTSGTSISDHKALLRPMIVNKLKYGSEYMMLNCKEITDDDLIGICQGIEKYGCDKLKELNLFDNKITSKSASHLFQCLTKANANLSSIMLSNNKLDDEFMESLGKYIQNNKTINILWLNNNDITDKGIEILNKFSYHNVVISNFRVNGNKGITKKSIPFLFKIIESLNIEDIEVAETGINSEDQFYASITINKFKNGNEYISFDQKQLYDKEVSQICDGIKKFGCSKLKELIVSGTKMTHTGVTRLLEALEETKASITKLKLSTQELNNKAILAIGKFIQNNSSIEILDISTNNINDKGIDGIFDYLIGNKTLRKLNISNNRGITNKSVSKLLKILEATDIDDLKFYGTGILGSNAFVVQLTKNKLKNGGQSIAFNDMNVTDDDVEKICESIRTQGCDKLKNIELNQNKISSKSALNLFETLKSCNCKVEILDLVNNLIDDECMKSLGEYIQENQMIKTINLGENQITDKGVETITEFLIGNTTLSHIEFSGNEGITDKSVPNITEIAEKSCLINIIVDSTSISTQKQEYIEELVNIPLEQRELPIKSSTKSAAKRI